MPALQSPGRRQALLAAPALLVFAAAPRLVQAAGLLHNRTPAEVWKRPRLRLLP